LQGNRDEAEAELRETMRVEPVDQREYWFVASVLHRFGKADQAEANLREALRLEPEYFLGHSLLAIVLVAQKKYVDAEASLREAVRIEPQNAEALNGLAWFLATVPSDDLRDGQEALELAKRACELTDYKMPHMLDTLAGAYAEAGEFKSAVEWSTKALELAGSEAQRDELTKHLESFREGKPWREE
jgi:Tfp pilus assembly protein PilF